MSVKARRASFGIEETIMAMNKTIEPYAAIQPLEAVTTEFTNLDPFECMKLGAALRLRANFEKMGRLNNHKILSPSKPWDKADQGQHDNHDA
jgi:hypothetical protein